MKLEEIINSDLSNIDNKEIVHMHLRAHEWYASSKLHGRQVKLSFIGTGALNSSRAGASLLIEFEGVRIQIDGEKSEDIQDNLDAILITDSEAWNTKAAKEAQGTIDTFEYEGLKIEPLKIYHTDHKVFGYKIEVENISIAYIPKMFEWPEWAEDMNLVIVDGYTWDNNVTFDDKKGGHRSLKLIAEDAQKHKIRQVIATHVGKDTEEALRDKRKIEGINFISDGSHLVYSATETFKDSIIEAHSKIFLEFIKRGLHHSASPVSNLDREPKGFPEIPSELFSQLININAKRGEDNVPTEFELWHNSLHNIWTVLRRTEQSILPSQELYNTHDMVVKELPSHPIWDSLDSHWTEMYKNMSFSKESNNFVLLYEVIKSFPEKIDLVSDAVLCDAYSVYIEKGFSGLLANSIKMKFCRKKETSICAEIPDEPIFRYNLSLVRSTDISVNQSETFPEQIILSKSFCYLIGNIVNDGISQHDVDLLLRIGLPDWLFQHIASSLVINYDRGNKLHILEDSGLGPQSNVYDLYDLILERKFY